jgi:hypothetical protein
LGIAIRLPLGAAFFYRRILLSKRQTDQRLPRRAIIKLNR